MAVNQLPSIELLRQLFRYDSETGKLYWQIRNADSFKDGKYSKERLCNIWNAKWANKETGFIEKKGYSVIKINGKNYKAHRIIWALSYGIEPIHIIDHKDRTKTNNRLSNLRIVNYSQNINNSGLRKDNNSGVKGVCFFKNNNKWVAYINDNNKRVYLGSFCSFDDAVNARKEAEIKYHGNCVWKKTS